MVTTSADISQNTLPSSKNVSSLSKSDQIILDILYVHEIEGAVNLQVFKPMVWGQAAIGKFLFSIYM